MANMNAKLEFMCAIGRHTTIPLKDAKRLLRYAATLQRLAIDECNRALTVAEIKKQERVQMDVIAIVAPYDCEAMLGGDPRGCVVKIKVPDGYTNDMGREGICVPA